MTTCLRLLDQVDLFQALEQRLPTVTTLDYICSAELYDGLLDEVRTRIIQGQSFQKIQSDLDNRFEPVHVAPEFHSDGDLVISQEQMDALQAELAIQCQLWNELTGVTAPKVE